MPDGFIQFVENEWKILQDDAKAMGLYFSEASATDFFSDDFKDVLSNIEDLKGIMDDLEREYGNILHAHDNRHNCSNEDCTCNNDCDNANADRQIRQQFDNHNQNFTNALKAALEKRKKAFAYSDSARNRYLKTMGDTSLTFTQFQVHQYENEWESCTDDTRKKYLREFLDGQYIFSIMREILDNLTRGINSFFDRLNKHIIVFRMDGC